MRDKMSTDPVAIHVRTGKINRIDCETICGLHMYDQALRKYLPANRVTINSAKDAPLGMKEKRVFSLTLSGADKLDIPEKWFKNLMIPDVQPYCPPVRLWVFCEECWDGGYRDLKHLADTTI